MASEAPRSLLRRLGSMVVLLVLVVGCTGDTQPEGEPAGEAGIPADPMEGLQLIVGIDAAVYPPGGAMQVRIQWVNRLDAPRTLEFPTSQRYELVILDGGGGEAYRWSAERSFLQVLGTETLQPGDEGQIWEETLVAPQGPGEYRLVASVESGDAVMETSLPFEVGSGGALP